MSQVTHILLPGACGSLALTGGASATPLSDTAAGPILQVATGVTGLTLAAAAGLFVALPAARAVLRRSQPPGGYS